MNAILLLAALHLLIMHQSQKRKGKDKEVLPAPASTPVIKKPVVAQQTTYTGFLSASFAGKSNTPGYHPFIRF